MADMTKRDIVEHLIKWGELLDSSGHKVGASLLNRAAALVNVTRDFEVTPKPQTTDDPRPFITPEELAKRWHDERELAARHYGIPWPPPPWEKSSEDYRATSMWAANKVIDWLRARYFDVDGDEHYAQGYAAGRAALTEETIPKLNALMERLLGRLDAEPEPGFMRTISAPCSACGSVLNWSASEVGRSGLPLVCAACREREDADE
jgi:hypothetical protein